MSSNKNFISVKTANDCSLKKVEENKNDKDFI